MITDPQELVRLYQRHFAQIGYMKEPICPKCGTNNGVLGTENAYFVCRDGCGAAVYWIDETSPDYTWNKAVQASPWGRPASLVRQIYALEARVKELEYRIAELSNEDNSGGARIGLIF